MGALLQNTLSDTVCYFTVTDDMHLIRDDTLHRDGKKLSTWIIYHNIGFEFEESLSVSLAKDKYNADIMKLTQSYLICLYTIHVSS